MQNLEAKFKLHDLARARTRAEEIGYRYQATLEQRDTFFRVAHGKLKLREESAAGAALIFYGREDSKGLRLSSYEIVTIAEPQKIRAMLTAALGVLATLNKRRVLLTRGNIRLHLDTVDELGEFGEIEAMLADSGDLERSRVAVEQLLDALAVERGGLIAGSYFEMLRPTR